MTNGRTDGGADWADLAKAEVARAHARAKLPILVGGTGLYLRTLLEGIAPVPSIDPPVREAVRVRTVEDNRAELEQLDPDAARRLNAADTTRIVLRLTSPYWIMRDPPEAGNTGLTMEPSGARTVIGLNEPSLFGRFGASMHLTP